MLISIFLITACRRAFMAQGRVSGASVVNREASALPIVHTVNVLSVANRKPIPAAISAVLPLSAPTESCLTHSAHGPFYTHHSRELPARELKPKPALSSKVIL